MQPNDSLLQCIIDSPAQCAEQVRHFSVLLIQAEQYELTLPCIVITQQLGQVGIGHIVVSQHSPSVDLTHGLGAPHGVHHIVYPLS
jgi:deoxycytidylate deaminase